MYEPTPGLAFIFGVVSAISLPMGAITAALWVPADRTVAFLMAFGGGALLAALSIELVAPALQEGHLYPLMVGWVLGGLLFIVLNEVVNNFGGFMRKASTAVYHLRKREHQQFRRVLSGLDRMEIFRELPLQDVKALAASIRRQDYRADSIIYHADDPADELFIVAGGVIELIEPDGDRRASEQVGKNEAFGHMAFITGTPHATTARALGDVGVWVLPKTAFAGLLPNSPTLIQAVHRWLRGVQVADYLTRRHGLDPASVRVWLAAAVKSLYGRGLLPPAPGAGDGATRFCRVADRIERTSLFVDLPADELATIAAHLIHVRRPRGHTFFHQGEQADRLFVVDQGEVSLIDPADRGRHPVELGPFNAFGLLACVTGSKHSESAIAGEETDVWMLRRTDLDKLLASAPEFGRRIRDLVQRDAIGSYLVHKQQFDRDKAERWTRMALRNMDSGARLPEACAMSVDISAHKGAPLAIWLGILLDGIPEALVIGASMVGSSISLSLLAGLFVSNYPEALSSSVGMKQQGYAFRHTLLMWSSLVLITGLLAAAGNRFFVDAPPALFAVAEGMAAGAMLTMIAQTMLPEAYFKGGSIIGLATLLGFLSAIAIKAFE
jgi:CRP-like cAMP-binding protein